MAPQRSHPAVTEDHELTITGHRLHCRTLCPEGHPGIGKGPTLVLLHEALGCITQWGRFPQELLHATGLPALIYDRYGHGQSEPLAGPRPSDYLEVEAFQALPQVLAAFGIETPILYGHSDGGTIALLYGAEFPASPAAIICEASHAFLEPITERGLRRAKEAYAKGPLRERLAQLHGDRLEALFHGWNEVWLSPARRHWDITGRLGTLRAPLLMIQGENDEYGSLAQVREVTARTGGPAEEFLIPGCGHAPHHQARSEVLERVTGFLRRVPRS
jgi:pimeloyl-ACP methyl ester carboxylesterase